MEVQEEVRRCRRRCGGAGGGVGVKAVVGSSTTGGGMQPSLLGRNSNANWCFSTFAVKGLTLKERKKVFQSYGSVETTFIPRPSLK